MLSDTAIKAAKAAKANPDKQYKMLDEKGMYVLIHPNGSKYFRLDYKIEGKRKTLALGIYPETSLKRAREKRDEARIKIADGIDPVQAKKAAQQQRIANQQHAFKQVFNRWIETNRQWSDGYRSDVIARSALHVMPYIGELAVNDITREELVRIVENLKLRKMHSKTASKIHSDMRSTFRYAIAEGICTHNYADDVEPLLPRNSTTKHHEALLESQIPEFLQRLDKYGGRYETIIAMRLLLWTATRTQETYSARWEEFNLENGLWSIPIERMKKRRLHVIPLPTQAISALKELKLMTGHHEYLFPNQQTPGGHMSENTLNSAIKKGLGFDCTAHGMRSTFSTVMNTLGWYRKDIIDVSLSHVDSSIRGIYNRADYLEERRQAMQAWADHLEKLKHDAQTVQQ